MEMSTEEINQICIDFRRMKAPQPISVIAQLNGVSADTVRCVLIEAGYKLPERRTTMSKEERQQRREQVRELAGKGLTRSQAAKKMGVTKELFRYLVVEMGLQDGFVKPQPPKLSPEEEARRAKWKEYRRRFMEKKRQKQLEEEMRACGLIKGGAKDGGNPA